ncbi:hypothetical protein N0V83_004024 [Neocucurbitaria cava]|uniref:Heterokaryon incompatibility domain-containing protein n=1 Tax=Neocucurbitaria cava TaxID=798079 RepID=A0A9W9CNV8_9PLEO|nr:hypothetical protein N0V83_004024 [Neocucurbitaria cava]
MRSREPSNNLICNECRQINFDQVLGLDPAEHSDLGFCIQKVGKRFRQRTPTNCQLCQILFDHCCFDYKGSEIKVDDGQDELRVFHFMSFNDAIDPLKTERGRDTRRTHPLWGLAVVPSSWHLYAQELDDPGLLLRSHFQEHGSPVIYHDDSPAPETFAVQRISTRFDLSLVTKWLQFCSQYHNKHCPKSNHSVDRLRLIDCESLDVKTAHPEDIYVALSYVWGSPDRDNAPKGGGNVIDDAQLPSILPAVISDAIKVTRLLGFRYLWIDKFCIDQDNPGIKHDQIRQMGRIYEDADLTIIAAAGLDENHGLPGVGSTPRKAQPAMEIGNVTILSSMQHPHSSIRSSKWFTRGWTFQEAMLSNRRLVFTDEQVYFECNAMNCSESVYTPLEKLHVKDKSKQRDILRAGVFGRNGKEAFGGLNINTLHFERVFPRYKAVIEEYSARDLRYDMDSMNAIIGVTRKFESLRHPYSHVWGIPFPVSVKPEVALDHFVSSLAWFHTQDCWNTNTKPRRRVGFPSWSWCGWAGQISFPLLVHNNLWAISFQDKCGMIHDFAETFQGGRIEELQELLLQARVLPSSAFSYNPASNEWHIFNRFAKLNLSQGRTSSCDGFWKELRAGRRWKCILIGSMLDTAHIMILESSHKDFWYRAGIFQIFDYRECEKIWVEQKLKQKKVATFRIK